MYIYDCFNHVMIHWTVWLSTLFLPDLDAWRSYKGWFSPWLVGIGLSNSLFFCRAALSTIQRFLELKAFADPELSCFLVADRIKEYRGFGGVRIEEMVIVTDTGLEIMSLVPRTIEEIEAWMSGKGEVKLEDLSKRYVWYNLPGHQIRHVKNATLESGLNIPLRLSIFGIFSRGSGLITDLKDLNFTS